MLTNVRPVEQLLDEYPFLSNKDEVFLYCKIMYFKSYCSF